MDQKISRVISIMILSIVRLLERMSYYGVRSLIVLYLIDHATFGIDRSDTLYYYGSFTGLLYLSFGPLGVISDFLLKQKNATLIGLVLAVVGYGLLAISNLYIMIFALFLIILGVGLVGPNMSVLLGQLFEKKEESRNTAFVIYLIGINIGAFLGLGILLLVKDNYGYEYAFGMAALFSLTAALLFGLTMRYMNFIEVNNHKTTPTPFEDDNPDILDAGYEASLKKELPPLLSLEKDSNQVFVRRHFLILIIGLACTLFWQLFEITSSQSYPDFDITASFMDLGILSIDESYYFLIQLVFFMPVALVFLLFVLLRKKLDTISIVATSLLLMAIHMLTVYLINSDSENPSFLMVLSGFVLLTFGELCVTAIAFSYVTRLANVKYASTIVGLFMTFTYLGMQMFNLVNMEPTEMNLLYLAIGAIVIGFAFFFLRRVFLSLSGGLE